MRCRQPSLCCRCVAWLAKIGVEERPEQIAVHETGGGNNASLKPVLHLVKVAKEHIQFFRVFQLQQPVECFRRSHHVGIQVCVT